MEATNLSAWLDLLSQTTRFITLETPAADGLLVEQFQGREAVNEDFRFELDCVSASAFLDLQALLGQPVSLGLARADGGRRLWHGYLTHAAALGADGGLARYRLVMESGLAFLRLRRNALIFQDKTALEVIAQVLDDHPQLRLQTEVTTQLRTRPICTQYRETDHDFVRRLLGEEGLSFRFEHDQSGAADDQDNPGHTLVIFDAQACQSPPEGTPPILRFHRIDATETTDAVTRFSEHRQWASDRVETASWEPAQVLSVAGNAQAPADANAPELPGLDVFEADRSTRFDTAAQARQYAAHHLDALRLPARTFCGQGAVRTLEAGKRYTLTQHPDISAPDFEPLSVNHHATNNVGTGLAHLHGTQADAELGAGSYRQHFDAIAAGTAIAPPHRDRPLAPGCSSAVVVGVPGAALTGTRDHQVRLQFPWQRGAAPLPGGLADAASSANPQGHAPGDDRSGTWVRVAETAAGAHHGHSFVPRIGSEVLVEYTHGDIDQPVVVGQLYNGRAAPPFAAGRNSDANHPGTLSGVRTQGLDGRNGSRWVLDDASGQLRHSLSHTLADSHIDLGYLIAQQDNRRFGYRGEGFELGSRGWTVVRAGEGLLLSASARVQGQSTQMDAAGALGQLAAAGDTARRLDTAAAQAKATGLDANTAQSDLHRALDPAQDGKYTGPVNGQSATKPAGAKRSGGAPVERFAEPAVLIESPERLAFTTPESAAVFAGRHLHLTAQRDAHLAAGAALGAAAGDGVGLYAVAGGLKTIANHGPLSIEAHGDALQVLADKSVTLASAGGQLKVLAKQAVVLKAGQCTVSLEGGGVTLSCPGSFTVKSASHAFMGPASKPAALEALPQGAMQTTKTTLKLDHRYHDNQGVPLATYEATLADGSVRSGQLDAQGKAELADVPVGGAQVRFGPAGTAYRPEGPTPNPAYKANVTAKNYEAAIDRYRKPDSSDAG